jgi:phosphotransferase system enzyme I (PtsI)
VAIGKIYLLGESLISIPRKHIPVLQVDGEVVRFLAAVDHSVQDLQQIKNQLHGKESEDHISVLDAHLLLLEDPIIVKETAAVIRAQQINAEWALSQVLEPRKSKLDLSINEYVRERKRDIDDVSIKILKNLMAIKEKPLLNIPARSIIVCNHLSPATLLQLDKSKIAGLVTEVGGRTSHAAIIARSRDIPAVFGVKGITARVANSDQIIVAGQEGQVILYPDQEHFRRYLEKRQYYKYREKEMLRNAKKEARTLDQVEIKIQGNSDSPTDIATILDYGGSGIGLYRTEYLFMNRPNLPGEEEQMRVYRQVLEQVAPHAAVIRTMDIGGDKLRLSQESSDERNPMMGLRAIRFSLKNPAIFRVQLRALYRASPHGQLKIMFPLVTTLDELREAKKICQEVQEELTRQSIPFQAKIPLGCMIEIPSAAIIADLLAKEVDFFSIGTNDLIQYCLGIDRDNEDVAYLDQPLHPAVLRIIKMLVKAAHNARIEIGICGEMASEDLYTLLLLGLGVNSLSMKYQSIPRIKNIIRKTSLKEAQNLARACLKRQTHEEVQALLTSRMSQLFPQYFSSESKV